MDITVIHVEDEDEISRGTKRLASIRRPDVAWSSFDGKDAAPVVSAIKAAIVLGHCIVYISDRNITAPFMTGEALWAFVWERLANNERAAISTFVAFCSSDGFQSLVQGVKSVDGFSGQIHLVAKPASGSELFGTLPP